MSMIIAVGIAVAFVVGGLIAQLWQRNFAGYGSLPRWAMISRRRIYGERKLSRN